MTIKTFKENLDTLLEIAGCTEEEELYFVVTSADLPKRRIKSEDVKLNLDSDLDIEVEINVNYNLR